MSDAPATLTHFRWLATVTYATETGPSDIDHAFMELDDLHDLIERGPSWDCIEKITIRLNRKRCPNPLTIEQAERQ